MIKINLNQPVKVKLTSEAIQILASRHRELREIVFTQSGNDIGEYVLVLDQNGFYTTQLWMLMDAFSDNTRMFDNTIFKNNDLYFETKYIEDVPEVVE